MDSGISFYLSVGCLVALSRGILFLRFFSFSIVFGQLTNRGLNVSHIYSMRDGR